VSGFAGVINADGRPVDEALLRRMAEGLAFRGPHGTTVRMLDSAGFCFTFARTGPAPQSPNLPLTLNGEQWLLGDVRLDGREALRRSLNSIGQRLPVSATDEELTLHAWRERGPHSGDSLLGDYAFGVWEPGAKRLVCVRDIIGAKPLFYGQAGNMVCFSNTLEVLRLVPGLDLRLDESFVGDFLLQGWCPDIERTVYQGIRRIKPGYLLEFQSGHLRSTRFAELQVQEPLTYRREEEYVEQFQSLFEAAVRERLPSGGKTAFFMSGGLDSTSVGATAARGYDRERIGTDFRAYTVDFRPLFDDHEPRFADMAAQHFGVPIEMVKAGSEKPFAWWTDETLRFPEPLHEPFQSRHVQMCRDVFDFAPVVLCGDGGDEILTGAGAAYARYLIRRGEFFELAKVFGGFLWHERRLPAMGTGLRGRWRRLRTRVMNDPTRPSWLHPEFGARRNLQDRQAELNRGSRSEHPLHPRGYALVAEGYWAGVLEEEDAAWLGVPLERRCPFLDRRLLEFLFRVPPIPWCMEKELLRRAMRAWLPDEVRTRRKTPLPQSPFALQVERLKWSALPLPEPHPVLREFVDWDKLNATLGALPGCESWDDLRPVSLNSWAKGVEKV